MIFFCLMFSGELHRHGLGVNELPVASPVAVDLNGISNVGDRARYPLVKAHGELPIVLVDLFFFYHQITLTLILRFLYHLIVLF